jgi:hypothetical protein
MHTMGWKREMLYNAANEPDILQEAEKDKIAF